MLRSLSGWFKSFMTKDALSRLFLLLFLFLLFFWWIIVILFRMFLFIMFLIIVFVFEYILVSASLFSLASSFKDVGSINKCSVWWMFVLLFVSSVLILCVMDVRLVKNVWFVLCWVKSFVILFGGRISSCGMVDVDFVKSIEVFWIVSVVWGGGGWSNSFCKYEWYVVGVDFLGNRCVKSGGMDCDGKILSCCAVASESGVGRFLLGIVMWWKVFLGLSLWFKCMRFRSFFMMLLLYFIVLMFLVVFKIDCIF